MGDGKDPSTFAPDEKDFNGNGIADSEETAVQSFLTPANGLIAAGIGALILGVTRV